MARRRKADPDVFQYLHDAITLPTKPGLKFLLMSLIVFSGKRRYCWWSDRALADHLYMDVANVRKCIKAMERHGLIAIETTGKRRVIYPLPDL